MEQVTKVITKILEIVLIGLMAIIVLDVSWQIFTRFILQDPSSYTEELAGFLLIWIGLLGASYALYTKAHLGIDILMTKVKGVQKRMLEILIYTIVLLFAFFVPVIGGIKLVNITFSLNQISAAMGIPMGYVYLVLPLTGVLMMYYSIVFILNAFKKSPTEIEITQIKAID